MPVIFPRYDNNFAGNSDFHAAFKYNSVKKVWEFQGYTCIHCEKTFNRSTVQHKHLNSCKGKRSTKYKVEPTPQLVLNEKRDIWKPFETNHKNP